MPDPRSAFHSATLSTVGLFVGRDVINKNTTDLAVRCSTGSVELSCVAINTPLGYEAMHHLKS